MNHIIGKLILTALIIILSKDGAFGQGKIEWTGGYPKPGSKGTIDVQGKVTLDPGWTLGSMKTVHRVWPSGGAELPLYDIQMQGTGPFTWGTIALDKLTPGSTYNVTAEVTVINQKTMQQATLRTGTGSWKAGN